MRTFRLDKLVRDGIPADMEAMGQKVTYHKLTNDEAVAEMLAKLPEEAAEASKAAGREAVVAELGDLQQLIEDICDRLGVSAEEIEVIKRARHSKRGGFMQGYFVETVSVDESDRWAEYYAADPERFPEVASVEDFSSGGHQS